MRRGLSPVGAAVALGVAFLYGAALSPGRATPVDDKKADPAKPPAGTKTAVFNMAAVMRDFHQAKYQVHLLNGKKNEISKQLLAWRDEYTKLQAESKVLNSPPSSDMGERAKRMLALTRRIEDEDREINKTMNDAASAIIADLYDMIKGAVDRVAERDGFGLVLAYPDAVTAEERKSPYIKELKLKPPAAQPFLVAPQLDITARVLKLLNEEHPPLDPETKQPVDVSKLPAPPPAAPVTLPPVATPRPN